MHVLRVPPARLEALRAGLGKKGATDLPTSDAHQAFRLGLGRYEIVGYGTGKVTVGTDQYHDILLEVLEDVLEPVGHTVVGSDEAGKGEWLGPLVAAAAAVRPDQRAELVARGVMDSKDVAKGRVRPLARTVEEATVNSTVLIAPPKFNELWSSFKAEGKNLNDLVAWAHAKALGDVLGALDEAGEAEGVHVLVDEFDRVRTEARASRAFDLERFPLEQRPRAEDEVAVAAASILAKAARERWIDAFERREQVPVRSLTMKKAASHAKVGQFAKVGFLSRA